MKIKLKCIPSDVMDNWQSYFCDNTITKKELGKLIISFIYLIINLILEVIDRPFIIEFIIRFDINLATSNSSTFKYFTFNNCLTVSLDCWMWEKTVIGTLFITNLNTLLNGSHLEINYENQKCYHYTNIRMKKQVTYSTTKNDKEHASKHNICIFTILHSHIQSISFYLHFHVHSHLYLRHKHANTKTIYNVLQKKKAFKYISLSFQFKASSIK